jgi:hypothetical protein
MALEAESLMMKLKKEKRMKTTLKRTRAALEQQAKVRSKLIPFMRQAAEIWKWRKNRKGLLPEHYFPAAMKMFTRKKGRGKLMIWHVPGGSKMPCLETCCEVTVVKRMRYLRKQSKERQR